MRWVELKRENLPAKLLLQLLEATPEELAAIESFLAGEPLPDTDLGAPISQPTPGPVDGSSQAGTEGGPAYVFRWTGRDWEVVFGGGRAFHLPNTLGARYLNYLLHEPNEPIEAFALEVLITPEKGEARGKNSIQPESDSQALREYRQALRRLKAERADAQAAGDQEGVERLDGEMEALESALREGGGAAGTGCQSGCTSEFGLAPLRGARTPNTLSGGRSPLAPNDHRLPSSNPPGWLPVQSAVCPNSKGRRLACQQAAGETPALLLRLPDHFWRAQIRRP